MLNSLKIKQGDKLSLDLVLDSQLYLKGKKYELDFYLEIFKRCYSHKEVKTLLMMLKLERVILPEYLEVKAYSSILELFEEKPDIIVKYCTEKDNKNKYYKLFYSLLLYFRANYEKEKVQSLLNQKELRKYFIEILSENYQSYSNVQLSEDFIDEMLKQENITIGKINNSLSFKISIEKQLNYIYKNIDLICEICKKKNIKIDMSEIVNPKLTDNLNTMIDEIQKILNYQLNKKIAFIIFNESFWRKYIDLNDKKNIRNLVLINEAISLCENIDNSLNIKNLKLTRKIHETGLEAIKKGELKNEALIDFLENDDIAYFKDINYETDKDSALEAIKGIDLETVDDKFYEKWHKSNIFQLYSFIDYDFKKTLANKINDMKDFGKLLKLFNYNDKFTDIILKEKFKELILEYKIDLCPNFIQDVSYFIYIIDRYYHHDIKEFMNDTIENSIQSIDNLMDIYLYLSSNYKDVSKNVIDNITNYFTKNEDKLKWKSILFLFQKLNSPNIINSLLYKLDNYVIKEEELFCQEEEIDSFNLLKEIEDENLRDKIPELNSTKYLKSAINLGENIITKIKEGEIKYNLFSSIWIHKKKILEERLDILLFRNDNDVRKCMNILNEYFIKFSKLIIYFKKLYAVLKEFYEVTHKETIQKLEYLEKKITEGYLKDIDKDETKKKIDELQNILPDLDKKYKLQNSILFVHLFKKKKASNTLIKEDDIFKETEEEFKKINILFIDNKVIIREFYEAFKNEPDKAILKELTLLKNYFNLKEYDEI